MGIIWIFHTLLVVLRGVNMLDVMSLIPWVSGVSGVAAIMLSFIMSTENIISSIIFKVFPFFIGIANILVFYKVMGW